jgi:hypothetical protein
MEQISVLKCLALLRAIREAVRKHNHWPELEKEVAALISSLEEEIRKSESLEKERRLKALISKAIWWISILFDLLGK